MTASEDNELILSRNIDPGTVLSIEEAATMTGTTGIQPPKRQYDESLVELAICKINDKTAEIKLDKSSKRTGFFAPIMLLSSVKSSQSQSY